MSELTKKVNKIDSEEVILNVKFNVVHKHLNNGGSARRNIVKNGDVIGIYKNRWYNIDKYGVRRAYVPSNTDLQASDWNLIIRDDNQIDHLNSEVTYLK